MTTFTMALKDAIEFTGGTAEIDATTGIRKLVGGQIGLEYFKTFVPDYKPTLVGKIVDHFWNREIGFESIDIFQWKMRTTMNEIMPLYNEMYKSLQIEFDPLATINMTTVSTGTSVQSVEANSASEAKSDNKGASRTVQSDTPQTMLSGNGDYASGGVDASSDATVNATNSEDNTSQSDTTQEGESSVKGYQGVASELLMRYRQSIINVDMMIITELDDLFMSVWDNGDSYFESGYYL